MIQNQISYKELNNLIIKRLDKISYSQSYSTKLNIIYSSKIISYRETLG